MKLDKSITTHTAERLTLQEYAAARRAIDAALAALDYTGDEGAFVWQVDGAPVIVRHFYGIGAEV